MLTQIPPAGTDLAAGAAEAVLAELTELLVDVIGPNFALEADIGMHTTFQDDLCLESIQFVVLAEELRARYGDEVDFVAWLAGMDLDAIIALRVGQLVDLIVGAVGTGGSDHG